MDAQLEKLKQEVEADLGRSMDPSEEIETKALFYFGKGVELKNQLESEPELLGDICKRVLEDMRSSMDRRRKQGRLSRIFEAMKEYLSGRPKRRRVPKQEAKQGQLWKQSTYRKE
ncbi:MAG: hypothetical protein ISS70_08135 [Phycisphaerae bacterium]|nr:hypothetical protein [Phycisphaerae bacterium]